MNRWWRWMCVFFLVHACVQVVTHSVFHENDEDQRQLKDMDDARLAEMRAEIDRLKAESVLRN